MTQDLSQFYENLESGRKIENTTVDKIRNKRKKSCSRYSITMNGKEYQIIDISQIGLDFIRCPDIEVYKSFEDNTLVARVEVKSYKKLYENMFDKIYGADPGEDFLTIKEVQFKDYLRLMEYEETDIYVVFYVYRTEQWFWQSLYELSNTIRYSGDAYNDGFNHYLWSLSDVRSDFENFLSEY